MAFDVTWNRCSNCRNCLLFNSLHRRFGLLQTKQARSSCHRSRGIDGSWRPETFSFIFDAIFLHSFQSSFSKYESSERSLELLKIVPTPVYIFVGGNVLKPLQYLFFKLIFALIRRERSSI